MNPGPKPKAPWELHGKKTYSFPPDVIYFLNSRKHPGAFISKLIRKSKEYKNIYSHRRQNISQDSNCDI